MFTIVILIEREQVCSVGCLNVLLMIKLKSATFWSIKSRRLFFFFFFCDSFHKVEASGAVGSLRSLLSPQMLKAANVKPAVAAYSMLRPCSCLGFQAESLHGKHFH